MDAPQVLKVYAFFMVSFLYWCSWRNGGLSTILILKADSSRCLACWLHSLCTVFPRVMLESTWSFEFINWPLPLSLMSRCVLFLASAVTNWSLKFYGILCFQRVICIPRRIRMRIRILLMSQKHFLLMRPSTESRYSSNRNLNAYSLTWNCCWHL